MFSPVLVQFLCLCCEVVNKPQKSTRDSAVIVYDLMQSAAFVRSLLSAYTRCCISSLCTLYRVGQKLRSQTDGDDSVKS